MRAIVLLGVISELSMRRDEGGKAFERSEEV